MRAYHPDDSGLLPAPDRKRREEEERRRRQGNGRGQGLLSPFMPGDQQALAEQMAMGFGGDPQKIRGMLSQIYSPMRFGFKPGQGDGGFGGNRVLPVMNPPPLQPSPLTTSTIINSTYPIGRGKK
jgi:hypothetical protein